MRHTACCSLYPLMARLASLLVLIASPMLLAAQEPASASSSLVRIADGDLQIGFDSSGSIRELIHVPDGDNRLAGFEQPFSLWEIDTSIDNKKLTLAPTQAGPPRIEPLSGSRPGLRLVWEKVPLSEERSLGVVVEVTLDAQGSRWTLSVQKPENVELKGVRFPRVPALKPRAQEVLAVPTRHGTSVRRSPGDASSSQVSSPRLGRIPGRFRCSAWPATSRAERVSTRRATIRTRTSNGSRYGSIRRSN